jgi:hypothetical protein
MCDAQRRDPVCRQMRDVLALVENGAGDARQPAANRHQQRGLARPVGADQRHDLAIADLQIDGVEGPYRAIGGRNRAQRQHHAVAASGSPR